MLITVKARDISFEQIGDEHHVILNPRYREAWNAIRGRTVTIETPDLGPNQLCAIGGRVWLVKDQPFRSLCEHQMEIGD